MPNFRRRKGKVFATLALNHHGDGRIALWLNTLPATPVVAGPSRRPTLADVDPMFAPAAQQGAARVAGRTRAVTRGALTSRSHVRRSLAAWHASP